MKIVKSLLVCLICMVGVNSYAAGFTGASAKSSATTGSGEFLLHVPKYCGIDVTTATGKFGVKSEYGSNLPAIEFLLVSNAVGQWEVDFVFSDMELILDASGVPISPSKMVAHLVGPKTDEMWTLDSPIYTFLPKNREDGTATYSLYLYFEDGVELTDVQAGDYRVGVTMETICDTNNP